MLSTLSRVSHERRSGGDEQSLSDPLLPEEDEILCDINYKSRGNEKNVTEIPLNRRGKDARINLHANLFSFCRGFLISPQDFDKLLLHLVTVDRCKLIKYLLKNRFLHRNSSSLPPPPSQLNRFRLHNGHYKEIYTAIFFSHSPYPRFQKMRANWTMEWQCNIVQFIQELT